MLIVVNKVAVKKKTLKVYIAVTKAVEEAQSMTKALATLQKQ